MLTEGVESWRPTLEINSKPPPASRIVGGTMRSFLVLVFLCFSLLTQNIPSTSTESTQFSPELPNQLEINRTPDGPVIRGLFGRFDVPSEAVAGCTKPQSGAPNVSSSCEISHCNPGSRIETICSNYSKSTIGAACATCTNYYCTTSTKKTDCCDECTLTAPPACVGCTNNGYCT